MSGTFRFKRMFGVVAAAGLVVTLAIPIGIGPAHATTWGVAIKDNFFSPFKVKAQQGDTVVWTNDGLQAHNTVAQAGFWDSGTMNPGATFARDFGAAGKYPYSCTIHGFTGTVVVPMVLSPTSGTTTTTFTVRWATTVPPGHVADVQIKRPGGSLFKNWRTGQTTGSATFVPDRGAGTYYFQARLRHATTGDTSAFTGAKAITVS